MVLQPCFRLVHCGGPGGVGDLKMTVREFSFFGSQREFVETANWRRLQGLHSAGRAAVACGSLSQTRRRIDGDMSGGPRGFTFARQTAESSRISLIELSLRYLRGSFTEPSEEVEFPPRPRTRSAMTNQGRTSQALTKGENHQFPRLMKNPKYCHLTSLNSTETLRPTR